MRRYAVFDMDGVLADFINGYTALASRRFGTGWSSIMSQGMSREWGHTGTTKEQDDALWAEIKADPLFWTTLLPIITPAEVRDMALLLKEGITTVYLTSRVGVDPAGQTARWVKRNDLPRGQVTVCPAHLKLTALRALDGKVLGFVDDKPDTVVATHAAGIPTYVRDWPYNRTATGVPRVSSVGEFIAEVLSK